MKNTFKVGDQIRYICTANLVSGSLTFGKVYEVLGGDVDGPSIINDLGDRSFYMAYRFELANSLIDDIKKAKSLIGKTVRQISIGETFIPEFFGVANEYNRNVDSRDLVDGYAVYLENQDYISVLSDLEEVTNIVNLTDDYNAIIEGDIVKVGCQNIPIEKVKEIIKLWESLS